MEIVRVAVRTITMTVFCAILILSLSGCGTNKNLSDIEVKESEDLEWIQKEEQWIEHEYEWKEIEKKLLQRDIERQEEYVTNGMLMQIDPENYYQGILKIYVETENFNVLPLFKDLMSGSNVIEDVADQIGWTVRDVSDLVTISINQFGHDGYLMVIMSAPRETEAENLLGIYKQIYEDTSKKITMIADHTDTILLCSVSKSVSSTFKELQENVVSDLYKLKYAYAEIK